MNEIGKISLKETQENFIKGKQTAIIAVGWVAVVIHVHWCANECDYIEIGTIYFFAFLWYNTKKSRRI